MPDTSEELANALNHQQAGRLVEAELGYRRVLSIDPGNAVAWQFLGVVAFQRGEDERAVQCIGRALELKPDNAGAHNNLGLVFERQGKWNEAAASYRRSLNLKPDHAEAHCNLGNVLLKQGAREEAAACYGRASELKPEFAEPYFHLGVIFRSQGKLEDAAKSFRQAIALRPGYGEAYKYLGVVLHEQNEIEQAAEAFRKAIEANPNDAEAHNNLGSVIQEQGFSKKAIGCFQRALSINPNLVGAYVNLGNALKNLGDTEKAIASHRRALELDPNYAPAHNNLGNVLHASGRVEEGIACYRRAIELQPEYAEAYSNLGYALERQGNRDEARANYRRAIELKPEYAEVRFLRAAWMLRGGELRQGWAEYDWLWKCKEFQKGALNRPTWDGSPLPGRKVMLLHADQGFGDVFQFIRFAPLVKQVARKVVLRCSKKIIPLLSSCAGVDKFVGDDEPLPKFDAESYLSSLPCALGTTLETIPREVPYLFADSRLVEQWREKLPRDGFKIGIAWQGNPKYAEDKFRSFPLEQFAPLAAVPGVRLISLQKGFGSEQIEGVKDRFSVLELEDFDESDAAFMDTAAVMMNLDLVITSDTAIAHLAGGLGVPVWVALAFMPDWRWMLDRADSPWYPTMRLFRQRRPGDWSGVFEEMGREVETRGKDEG